MVDYKDLGHRVRTLRRRNKLTQAELAEKAGISGSFLGHIERGTRIASLDTLVAICNTLKVTPQELLTASLEDGLTARLPTDLSADERAKLSTFLRMANEVIDTWSEEHPE